MRGNRQPLPVGNNDQHGGYKQRYAQNTQIHFYDIFSNCLHHLSALQQYSNQNKYPKQDYSPSKGYYPASYTYSQCIRGIVGTNTKSYKNRGYNWNGLHSGGGLIVGLYLLSADNHWHLRLNRLCW